MRVQPIGMNGTLVILSRRELTTLIFKLDKKEAVSVISSKDAPGYAVMAEEDRTHYARLPAEKKKTAKKQPVKA